MRIRSIQNHFPNASKTSILLPIGLHVDFKTFIYCLLNTTYSTGKNQLDDFIPSYNYNIF